MTIQSISGTYQAQSSMKADFRSLVQSMKAFKDAESSGNQDQVTLSQNAVMQAAAQVQTDISGTQKTQPANSNFSQLQNDLQTLQTALNSTGQSQGSSSQNTTDSAINKIAGDIAALHKGHGFRQRLQNVMNSANPGNNANNNDTISSLAALFGTGNQSQNSGSTLNLTA